MILDARTVVITSMLAYALSAFVMVRFWRETGKRYPVLTWFMADFICLATGNFFIVLRDFMPAGLSIMLSSPVVLAGMLLGLHGLGKFLGIRIFLVPNLVLLGVCTAGLAVFAFLWPNLALRNIIISSATLIYCGQCAVLLLFRQKTREKPAGKRGGVLAGVIFSLISVTAALRASMLIANPLTSNNFFLSPASDIAFLLVYQFLVLLLVFSLILMFTRKLGQDLQVQEFKFSKAFEASPDAVMVSEFPGGHLLEANHAFEVLSGWPVETALGKTTVELRLWESLEMRKTLVAEIQDTGVIRSREAVLRRQDGSAVTVLVSGCLIREARNSVIVSNLTDITGRKQDEERIKALLAEKDLLLREIHHRVRNNLNVVFGLLVLQAEAQEDSSAGRALTQAAGQVKSMTCLYDKLYLTDQPGEVNVRDYLDPLGKEILDLFPWSHRVKLEMKIQDFSLKQNQATVLGLILNELVTNSFKYAFPRGQEGSISCTLGLNGRQVSFAYADSGNGGGQNPSWVESSGFGLGFMAVLARQLGGTVAEGFLPQGGFYWRMDFPV